MTASMAAMAAAAVTAVTANIKKASLLSIAVVLLIALPFIVGCEAITKSDVSTADSFQLPSKPTGPNRYVQDLAGILTPSEEKQLVDLSAKVEKETTAEMLFLTVEIDDPDNLRGLADRVLHEWGVGKQDKDNGIVIAVAARPGDFVSINAGTRKRNYVISTGYGTEGIIPDLKANEIAKDKMVPLFQKNEWAEGLSAGGSAVAALFYEDKRAGDVADSEGQTDMAPINDLASSSVMPPTIVVILALIAFIGLCGWLVYLLVFKGTKEETYTPPIVDIDDDDDAPLLGTLLTGAVLGSTLESGESSDDSDEEYHRPHRPYSDDDSGSSSSSGIDFGGGSSSSSFDTGGFGGGDGGGGGADGSC